MVLARDDIIIVNKFNNIKFNWIYLDPKKMQEK